MRIFHSETHRLHAPKWYVADGTVRPCPEVPGRVEALMRGLTGRRVEGVAGVDPWGALQGIHTAAYLEYLRGIHAVWHAEFGREGGVDVIPDTFVPPHRRGELRCPTKPSAQAGYFCFDMAAPITAGTWEAAVGSAACAVAAAESVIGGGRGAYAICRPPGHHAGADYCGGFCFLNNAGAAAQHFLNRGAGRVAILDVDYHHGNGTQDIFYERGDVLFVSIHADPNTQYPYFWGHAAETGAGVGLGLTRNFPLARGTGEELWLETLDRALEVVGRFMPEGLVVSLGLDISERDTVGDFGVGRRGFGEIGRRVAGLELPTVFVQEGGYNAEEIGGAVVSVLDGFSPRDA